MREAVVTLVHGTFAPNAAWVQKESAFCTRLAGRLTDLRLQFEPFGWSGGNSHAARLEAGDKLARHIHRIARAHPLRPHVVVAHSHGGNVALYAMRDQLARRVTRGIATMGTPFVRVRARELQSATEFFRFALPVLLAPMALVLCIALAAGLLTAIESFGVDTDAGPWELIAVLGSFSMFCGSLPAVHDLVKQGGHKWALRTQEATLRRLSLPSLPHLPILCVRTPLDEAAVGLGIAHQISEAPFRAWPLLYGVLRRTLIFALVAVLALLAVGAFEPRWENAVDVFLGKDFLGLPLALWMVVLAVAAFALQAIMSILPRFTHSPAFGGETVADNWLVETRIAGLPERCDGAGYCNVDVLSLPMRLRTGKLAHSELYEHEETLEHLAGFIRSVLVRDASHVPREVAGLSLFGQTTA